MRRSRVRVGELPESVQRRVLVVLVNGRGRDVGRAGRSPTSLSLCFSLGRARRNVLPFGFVHHIRNRGARRNRIAGQGPPKPKKNIVTLLENRKKNGPASSV